MKINLDDLENIVQGACFLASGGGGNIMSAQDCIDASGFSNEDEVEVVNYSEIKDNEWIIPTSGMGDPMGGFTSEDLNSSMPNVIELMQDWCENNMENFEDFKYILPMEVGTLNSVLPIITAKIAKDKGIDLKIVNADPSGRATPSLPLTLFAGYKDSVVPNFMGSGKKNEDTKETFYGTFNVDSIDTLQESFGALSTSKGFGQCGSFALYPKSKETLKPQYIVEHTMEDALKIGEILNKEETPEKRANAIVDYMKNESQENRDAKMAFYGKLIEMNIKSIGGEDVGTYTLLDEKGGKKLKIGIANENIYANIFPKDSTDPKDEKTFITGPDSICIIPEFSNTRLQNKNNIKVMDVTALKWWHEAPISNDINLYVIWIEASQKVKDCKPLIETWNKFSKKLDGFGDYPVSS